MPSTPAPATKAAFEAFYLQRATAELAEDLDQLRTAPDFTAAAAAATATASASASGSNHGAGAAATDTAAAHDNALQMLIGALRQGAAMFSAADQQRVVGGGGGGDSCSGGQQSG